MREWCDGSVLRLVCASLVSQVLLMASAGSAGAAVPEVVSVRPTGIIDAVKPFVDESGNTALVWEEGSGSCSIRARVRAARGSRRVVRVSGRFRDCVDAGDPVVAGVGARGLVVAWRELTSRSRGTEVVKARSLDYRGRLGEVRSLGRGGSQSIDQLAIAGSQRGSVGVLWSQYGYLYARVRDKPGSGFGRRIALYRARDIDEEASPEVRAAFDERETLRVVWALVLDEVLLQARSRPAGGRFGPTRTLARYGEPPGEPDVQLTTGRGVGTLVAWYDHTTVYSRQARPGSDYGSTVVVGRPGGFPSVAIAGGMGHITWSDLTEGAYMRTTTGFGRYGPAVPLPAGGAKIAADARANLFLATNEPTPGTQPTPYGPRIAVLRRSQAGGSFGDPIVLGTMQGANERFGIASYQLAAGGANRAITAWRETAPGLHWRLKALELP
jgi:hypothetical protein